LHAPTAVRARRVALEVAGLAGVAVLAVAWIALDGQSRTLYRGGFLLCGLAATAVIAAATHPQRGPIAHALALPPLVGLGLISYGVYLYHWPIDIVVDRDRIGFGGWPLILVQVLVTLAVSIASFYVVERPIRRGAIRAPQWRVITPVVAGGLALAIVAATAGAATSVFVPVVGKHPVAAARDAYDRAPLGSKRVLLVGNSVAFTLGPGFAALGGEDHIAVFDAAIPACSFPPQLGNRVIRTQDGVEPALPCDESWEPQVVKAYRPDIVFWVVSNPGGHGGKYKGRQILPCTATYDRLYVDALTREIAHLRATGAEVVVTTAASTRTFGLVDDRQTECDNALRRTVARATGSSLADLFEFVCPHGVCHAFDHGVKLRPDGLHYTGGGAVIVARWLLAQAR
jgi:hypothetical protein